MKSSSHLIIRDHGALLELEVPNFDPPSEHLCEVISHWEHDRGNGLACPSRIFVVTPREIEPLNAMLTDGEPYLVAIKAILLTTTTHLEQEDRFECQ